MEELYAFFATVTGYDALKILRVFRVHSGPLHQKAHFPCELPFGPQINFQEILQLLFPAVLAEKTNGQGSFYLLGTIIYEIPWRISWGIYITDIFPRLPKDVLPEGQHHRADIPAVCQLPGFLEKPGGLAGIDAMEDKHYGHRGFPEAAPADSPKVTIGRGRHYQCVKVSPLCQFPELAIPAQAALFPFQGVPEFFQPPDTAVGYNFSLQIIHRHLIVKTELESLWHIEADLMA